jgi:predicted nucleic acid-binding protein
MGVDFLDTNILIYAFTPDSDKAARAESLLASSPQVSVQGLNEMVNVLRRKRAFSWAEVDDVLTVVSRLCAVQPQGLTTHQQARELAPRYRLGWWDSLQLASALEIGADTFWSEDLQHGLLIEQRLRVRNPFRREPEVPPLGAR